MFEQSGFRFPKWQDFILSPPWLLLCRAVEIICLLLVAVPRPAVKACSGKQSAGCPQARQWKGPAGELKEPATGTPGGVSPVRM